MLKIHKDTKQTSDPLQTRSWIAIPKVSSDNTAVKAMKNEQKKALTFDSGTKNFDANQNNYTQDLMKQNQQKYGDPSGSGLNLNLLAGGIDSFGKVFTQMNKTNDSTRLGIRDAVSSTLIQSGDPTMMAIGAATKTLDAIGDATGFHTEDIDKEAGKNAGISDAATLNNIITTIPGMGLLTAPFTQKTKQTKGLTDYTTNVIASYSGVDSDINSANKLSGKRLLFGINGANAYVNKTNDQIDLLNEIGRVNTLRKRSDYATDIAQQNLNRYAGTNYPAYAVGKNGMKIMSRKELQAILATRKLQKGGIIGTDTNLLPDGALHARLNHLQETNPDLEDVTRKGIPVLDEQGSQIAEIEGSELILRLELTKKIEELMKEDTDQAMIEAGKLLVDEIILNTQDNTGQITEEVENG